MLCAETLLIAAINSAQVVRIVVWTGLVATTVVLLVLMRTRWGQSQPLAKCIVLSTLVHLMFAIYTTTVDIYTASLKPGNDAPMWVSISTDDSIDSDDDSQQPDQVARDVPWEGFAPQALNDVGDLKSRSPRGLEPNPDAAELPSLADQPLDRIAKAPAATDETRPTEAAAPLLARRDHDLFAAKIEAPAPKRVEPPDSSTDPLDAQIDRRLPGELAKLSPSTGPLELPRAINSSTDTLLPFKTESDQITPGASLQGGRTASRPAPAGIGLDPQGLVPIAKHSTATGQSSDAATTVPTPLQGRLGNERLRRAIANGGSQDTEAAVVAALRWLALNQAADGRWNPAAHEAGQTVMIEGHDRRGAGSRAETGISGLALLAFLAHGETHLAGENRQNVQRGLEWLLSMQAADGCLAGEATTYERMYCHAMATCALSEAYAMTGDQRLRAPVQQAVGYCVRSQDARSGGWRYQPGDPGDTSQLGWQVMALKSAELAGIEVPTTTRDGVLRFLKSVSSGRAGGLASYRPGHRVTQTMTAEALVCRQFWGMSRGNPAADEAGNYIMQELPGQGEDNVYYWYYGTLGMFQLQGQHWQAWNKSLQHSLLGTQRRDGRLQGSWDPDRVWGAYGGRVYSTALSTLCLEVYYRFLPLYIDAASRETQTK